MPTLVTPNDSKTLRELCTRSEAAISSLNVQIDTLKARIVQSHDAQEKLEHTLLEDVHKGSERESQLQELRSRYRQAQTSAAVASGTPAEASTASHVASLGSEIETLQKQIETHRKEHARLETSTGIQQLELQQQIDQSEKERETLVDELSRMRHAHLSAHMALGQAILAEAKQSIGDMIETRDELKASLAQANKELDQAYEHLPKQLAQWPDLLKKAEQELIPAVPDVLPADAVVSALRKYLSVITTYGTSVVNGSRTIDAKYMPTLLSVPTEFVAKCILGQVDYWTQQQLETRYLQLTEFLREKMQEQEERARRRALKGWD